MSTAKAEVIADLAAEAKGISRTERQALVKLLHRFADTFSIGDEDDGRASVVHHKIDTGDASPVKQAARRLPYHLRGKVQGILDKMQNRGIIEPANGPRAAPIVLVKKNGWVMEIVC